MVVFSLTGWSPFLPSGFLVSRRTPDSARRASAFTYGNFTLCVIPSQVFRLAFTLASRGPTPNVFLHSVWALPISLATTFGITFVFFSSGYLDVSVPRVPLRILSIHIRITRLYPCGVPSFGYLRITGYLLLPATFRSLSRPSSAPRTKASSVSPL